MALSLAFCRRGRQDAGRIHAFGARSASDTRHARLVREILIAAQIMLTMVLLTASVSVGHAFLKLMHLDRGFDTKGLITASVSLDGTTHQLAGRPLAYFEKALARIRRLPGVRSASATDSLPLYATGFIGDHSASMDTPLKPFPSSSRYSLTTSRQ